ncbi:MAG TPA: YrbL family protein [Dokdonella sp.]
MTDHGAPALRLSDATPIASGQIRRIFEHPHDARLLIKILRPDSIERRWKGPLRAWKRLARALHYNGHVRELREYITACARHPARPVPIARTIGVIETDLGLGLVAEKVVGPGSILAPTLATRYASEGGFSAALERDLKELLEGLLACNVIVGDMHAWNIVYGSDSRGGPRFVLIDGFGEKLAIPLTSMSQRFNAHNTRRLYRRMREQLAQLVPLEAAETGVAAGR